MLKIQKSEIKLYLLASMFLALGLFASSCLVKEDPDLFEIEGQSDTATMDFVERGLLLDTRTNAGLANASVQIFAITNPDSNKLVASAKTDSNGIFSVSWRYFKFNSGFRFVFEHENPVYLKRTYSWNGFGEKVNDSTSLFYLHRKAGCKISLVNNDGSQKNVMFFNDNKNFSKLLMNLRRDTTFYYLLEDYNDIIFFDYFPQTNLQKFPIRGSTNGDTVEVKLNY